MRIDVHGWIVAPDPGAPVLGALEAHRDTAAIDRILVANRAAANLPPGCALDETEANSACLALCRTRPWLEPLYWARVVTPDSHPHTLVGALESEPFRGVVFSPADNEYEADSRQLDPFLAALATVGRPAVFIVRDDARSAPPRVLELARRHPKITFVLCIGAHEAALRDAALETSRRAQRLGVAEIYVDTAHASQAEIVAAARSGLTDRLVYGSDAPTYGSKHGTRCQAVLSELQNLLSEKELDQITSGTAGRIFGLSNSISD